MPDSKSRERVKRLIGPSFRPDDLTGLFLYARDHCDGREPVVEVGDFVAHHSERNKGIVTRITREWFATVRYFAPSLVTQKALDLQQLPRSAPEYFRCAARRIDAKVIKDRTGLTRVKAASDLSALANRLTRNPDGTFRVPTDITDKEFELIDCVTSVIVVKPAFDGQRLFEDFRETLRSNGLIKKDEVRSHSASISSVVQLYAIAAMHKCIIQLEDGISLQLEAKAEPDSGQIQVIASVPVDEMPGLHLSCAIFSATLDPKAHCHPDLLAQRKWTFDIEVNLERLLAPLD